MKPQSWIQQICAYCKTKSMLGTVIIFFALFIALYVNYFMFSSVIMPQNLVKNDDKCEWKMGDPVMYNLKTKLGVTYEGDHWFHMSENFLTQHSIIRENGGNKYVDAASSIIFNFDSEGFVHQLNGVTRLLVAIGLSSANDNLQSLYYGFMNPSYMTVSHLAVGDTFRFHQQHSKLSYGVQQMFKSLHSMSLGPEVHFENRFLINSHESSRRRLRQMFNSTDVDSLRVHLPLSHDAREIEETNTNNVHASSVHAAMHANVNVPCVKFVGTVGGMWPTPQRGHWFENPGDVDTFREKIRNMCPSLLSKNETRSKSNKKYKLVLYQRDLNRKLEQEEDALGMIKDKLNMKEWEIVTVIHKQNRSPCDLAMWLRGTDVLVTPHGFQSMLLLFLSVNTKVFSTDMKSQQSLTGEPVRPSVLFEIFPYRYFKRAYGPLSKELGIVHSSVMSPPLTWDRKILLSIIPTWICMNYKECREYARGDNVRSVQSHVIFYGLLLNLCCFSLLLFAVIDVFVCVIG